MGYPSPDDVRDGVAYGPANEYTGTLTLPDESVVLEGYTYGGDGTEFTGTVECIPATSPTSPAPFSSPFAAIAYTILGRLATSLGINLAYVRPVANDRYKVTIAEPVFLYVQFFTPGKPREPGLDFTDAGAGRLATLVGRRVRVYVYTRSGEDSYGGDEIALYGTDPSAVYSDSPTTPGHFLVEERVYNSLLNYTPLSAGGDRMTIGPLHPLDASEEPQRAAENDAGLLRSCLDFEVVYLLAVDETEPQV